MIPQTYNATKILTNPEIDVIWNTVRPSNSDSDVKRGNIPMIKTTIESKLLKDYSFDIAKCYTLSTQRFNHNEKPHQATIKRIRDLVNSLEMFYYTPECYGYWDMGYSDYCFTCAKNNKPTIREHYILNTLNDRLVKLMKDEKWDICINQIIIALGAFTAEKTNSFHILRKFAILIAPFLPYTAERVWQTLKSKNNNSIFCENYPEPDTWFSRKNYTLYKVFINDDTQFTYESYDFMDDDMTIETFKGSISLSKHLDGRVLTKIKLIKDRYIIVNAE